MGNVGRFVSSNSSVVVNTPVIESAGLSVANAVFERLNRPTSVDAVEDTIRRS